MRRIASSRIALGRCLLVVLAWWSVAPALAQTDRGIRFTAPEKLQKYRKQWAVIVGVDYTAEERVGMQGQSVPPLTNAENDARALRDLLIANYGYQPECCELLIGAKAKRDALNELLHNGFLCDPKKISKDDSVLFFFAGHGKLRNDTPPEAFLLPIDFAMTEQELNWGSLLELNHLAEEIGKHCPARHKLFILDSCHSGAISHFRPINRLESGTELGLLREPVFQAVTATRSLQTASDGKVTDDHSPFTNAILKSLRTIPVRQGVDRSFTVTQLFQTMQAHLDHKLPSSQTPDCLRLTGDQGDFHFFPQGDFQEDADDLHQQERLLIAMVPGEFGNWWVDETPWFIPSLRLEILQNQPEERSVDLALIEKRQLREAARDTLSRLRNSGKLAEIVTLRLQQLDRLLNPRSDEPPEQVFRDVAAMLEKMISQEAQPGNGPVDQFATDLHLLAAVKQKLSTKNSTNSAFERVRETYVKALERYETVGKEHRQYQPLQALCLSDYAGFLASINQNEEAAEHYRKAHGMFYAESPLPFRVYVLCREADSLQQLGLWGQSAERMDQAQALARRIPAPENRPHRLVAVVESRSAWADMVQWRIHNAETHFQNAKTIFEQWSAEDLAQAASVAHLEHGLAMAARFQGRTDDAIQQFRELTGDLQKLLRRAETDRDLPADYRELRHLIVARLANSLERLGDTHLFAQRPDFAEAANCYRRALAASERPSGAAAAGLLFRRAIALAVPSESQDVQLAEGCAADADALAEFPAKTKPEKGNEQKEVAVVDKKPSDAASNPIVRLQHDLAHHLIAFGKDQGDRETDLLENLRQAIQTERTSASLIRDELETRLFAARWIVQLDQAKDSHVSRYQRLKDVEYLADLCRSVSRQAEGDPGLMTYLRPYYDTAIESLIRLEPKDAKQLIEMSWESRHAEPFQRDDKPLLVMHVADDHCCFFFDLPRGTSKVIESGTRIDQLRSALLHGEKLPLPPDLRKELSVLNATVTVQWQDNVWESRILEGRIEHRVAKPTGDPDQPTFSPEPKTVTREFPFDVKGLNCIIEPN